jgi:hypothetical protein
MLPEDGRSEGSNSISVLACALGAKAWLKKTPVRFVKRKRAKTAKGANLKDRKCKWGILRGNVIYCSPPCERRPGGHQNYILLCRIWGLRMVETINKELQIETGDKMDISLHWLLFRNNFDTAKSLNLTYLNQPPLICHMLELEAKFVHREHFRGAG